MVKESKKIIPISFDPVFTGIFNDEKNIDIVENFLSVYLNIPLGKIKGHISIKSRKIESKPKKERKKEVDLVLDIEGKKLNIEMNSNFQTPIVDRNIVFICKIHGGQLKVGDNRYTNIKDSLQINLNTEKTNEDSLVESYCLRNEKGKILSKKLRIDVVDIARAKKFKYNKNEEKLARWLRALVSISLEELEKELGDDLMEKESKEKLLEEVEKYSEDEEIYDMYKYHSKQELIQNSLIDEARIEAREEGIQQEKLEIAKNLLNENIDINIISKTTGLDIKEIEKLQKIN